MIFLISYSSLAVLLVFVLSANVNIMLMLGSVVLQGSPGSPGPSGRDGAKGETVSFFVLSL